MAPSYTEQHLEEMTRDLPPKYKEELIEAFEKIQREKIIETVTQESDNVKLLLTEILSNIKWIIDDILSYKNYDFYKKDYFSLKKYTESIEHKLKLISLFLETSCYNHWPSPYFQKAIQSYEGDQMAREICVEEEIQIIIQGVQNVLNQPLNYLRTYSQMLIQSADEEESQENIANVVNAIFELEKALKQIEFTQKQDHFHYRRCGDGLYLLDM